ncbi:MAG: hypothetical protein IT342_08635 [Candidatus Melainabacteria bacterium]|nr:hypothetical protein [Candidatus Melainabacteria bacterium]
MAKILIIEDDVAVADLVVSALKSEKHTIDKVHTGADGVNYLESGNYDLLILCAGVVGSLFSVLLRIMSFVTSSSPKRQIVSAGYSLG